MTKILLQIVLGLALVFRIYAEEPQKSSERDLISLYFHNSELQTHWALNVLSHYHFRGDEKVLDFGTGDGKVAALMSFMVPEGSVTGVDISEPMIHFARKMFRKDSYPNLLFSPTYNINFDSNIFINKFDVITSFCVFHLIVDPVKVFYNFRTHLNENGRLILTFPIGGDKAFFSIVADEMAKRGWHFPRPDATRLKFVQHTITKVIDEAGFKLDYVNAIENRVVFNSKNEFIDWMEGTFTTDWDVPANARHEFFTDLANAYLTLKPQEIDEEGFVTLLLKRLDIIASVK